MDEVEGSNPGHSLLFLHSSDCYDATLAAGKKGKTVQLRSGTPQQDDFLKRGLNEGGSGEENEDDQQAKVEWIRETVRFVSKKKTIKWLMPGKERHGEKIYITCSRL